MKARLAILAVGLFAVIGLVISVPGHSVAFAKELVIADFDTGDKPNNIGGDFGAWSTLR